MDSKHLQLFVEVVRRGSFAAVARDRDLDPSSVSRAIAGLEQDLGLRLFQRTTRKLALTEAGHLYFSRVEAVLDELKLARDQALAVSSRPRGCLRLTASVAFGQMCLTPLLPSLRRTFPELKLELFFTDTNLDLVAERIDLAIRMAPKIRGDVIATRLRPTRYHVCAAPAYLKQAPALKAPADLSHHRCLLFTLANFRSSWLFQDRRGEQTQVAVDGDVIISNALSLRDCALAGMGPALLADWLVGRDIAEGRLVKLFPAYQVTATDFETAAWGVYPSRSYLPHKVKLTLQFLRAAFDRMEKN